MERGGEGERAIVPISYVFFSGRSLVCVVVSADDSLCVLKSCSNRGRGRGGTLSYFFHEILLEIVVGSCSGCSNALVTDK